MSFLRIMSRFVCVCVYARALVCLHAYTMHASRAPENDLSYPL